MWPHERPEAHFTSHRLLFDQLGSIVVKNTKIVLGFVMSWFRSNMHDRWWRLVIKVALIVAYNPRSRWSTKVFSCPFAQQVWHYAVHIMWQFFSQKRLPWSSEILLNDTIMPKPLWWESLRQATTILQSSWFFLRSSLLWIIWWQRNDLVFNIVVWPMEKENIPNCVGFLAWLW